MTHEQAYALLPDLVGLRLVDAGERELRRHIADCSVCAERLSRLEHVERALDVAAAVRTEDLSGLEARVFAIPDQNPRRPPNRFVRRLVPAGIGLAAAASIAALTLALSRPDMSGLRASFESQQTVALHAVSGGVTGTVQIGRPTGQMRVVRLDIQGLPTDEGTSFDLWFMSDSGAMRAGSFGPGKDGNCIVDLTTPRDERWDTITITPTGAGPRRQVLASS